ncbi:Ig lambda chain C region [Solea senegalensis]|uniref:Ig lambda chain C region n=1 Tax=Solea senegalensis TaxID=28829 RepID=A0AAV6SBG1_SOLSE|nr:Ig lambda chain C region [Solea senegalensis]
MMKTTLTFIVLLGCGRVWTFVSFSEGIHLLVLADEDHHHHSNNNKRTTTGDPSVHLFSTVPSSQDSNSQLLVCLVSGLARPLQDVLWWVDDTLVTSADTHMSLMRSEEGGAYSAVSVWEVSAADCRSTYWCGTVVDGHVHRQRWTTSVDSDNDDCHVLI